MQHIIDWMNTDGATPCFLIMWAYAWWIYILSQRNIAKGDYFFPGMVQWETL